MGARPKEELGPDGPLIWAVARASLCYVRDAIEISRGDGDLLDTLIFTAALDANMAAVEHDSRLQIAYGGVSQSAPDELRRPVSMHAIAQSLGLPPETVRRRFRRLVRAGACIPVAGGVIVPRSAVVTPDYMAKQRARYDRAAVLHDAVTALGIALPEGAEPRTSPPWDEPPVRAANRALSEYTLRACQDLIGLTGDVMRSLVLLDLVLANTEALTAEALDRWVRDPERRGRPVRVGALAARLRFSGETIRRHLNGLQDDGYAVRVPGGVLATAPPARWAALRRLVEANRGNLERLFERLRRLGVLAAWRDEASAGAPAEEAQPPLARPLGPNVAGDVA